MCPARAQPQPRPATFQPQPATFRPQPAFVEPPRSEPAMATSTVAALFGNTQMATGMMMADAMKTGNEQEKRQATELAVASGGMSAKDAFMGDFLSQNTRLDPSLITAMTSSKEVRKGMMLEQSGMMNQMGMAEQALVLDKVSSNKPSKKGSGGISEMLKYELFSGGRSGFWNGYP